jgi:RHS repeat-associated protein
MRRLSCCGLLLLAVCFRGSAYAQDYINAIGNPTFGVNIPIENGFINVANGNVHLELSLANHPQRGNLRLNERLVYDSRIWQIIQNGGYSWQPTNVANSMAGWRLVTGGEPGFYSVSSVGRSFECDASTASYTYWLNSTLRWTDPSGTTHTFDAPWRIIYSDCPNIQPQPESTSGWANDSSGYFIQASGNNDNPPTTVSIVDGNGTQVDALVNPAIVDRFGNYWSADGNGNLVDDLGRTPVLTTTNGTQITYSVLNFGGGRSPYLVNTEQIGVSTQFNQSAVSEFSGTLTAIQSIQLPDGSSYSFSYDGYGELTSMTLPTGGVVGLGYSNYQDSYQNENRWLTSYSGGHGSLTLTPSVLTQCSGSGSIGCQEQMKVTDASTTSNDTVYTLTLNNGAWNMATDYYNGPMGGGQKLISIAATYDFSNPCPTGNCVGAEFITKQTDVTTLTDVGFSKQTTYGFDSHSGKVNYMKQWDYYAGSPPSTPTLDTEYSYTGYDLTQVQVLDGGGKQLALSQYGFNSTANPSSAPSNGHNASLGTNGPYLASVGQWINNTAQMLTTTFTSDDAGTQLTSTDPNGQTTSSHDATDTYLTGLTPPIPSSGVSLPNSATYDVSTGLPVNTTDPNGAVTTYNNYDWAGRPGIIDYSDGGQESHSYSSNQTGEGHTIGDGRLTDRETLVDGYGKLSRVAVLNGNGYYQTDYCYDANGRLKFQSYVYSGSGWGTPKLCSGAGDTYSYDSLGRLTQVAHSDGTSVNYQYQGRATEVTDENGVSLITQVDGLGRTTGVCEISTNGNMPNSGAPVNCGMDMAGNGFLTNYNYDLVNHKTTVTQGVQSRVFQTDSLGRTILVQEPESGTTTYSYAYSGTGLVVTRKRPRANQGDPNTLTTTTTQYDSIGRVVSVNYDDGTPNKTFAYDAACCWNSYDGATNLKGRLAVMGAGDGTSSHTGALFGYDIMGRVSNLWQCTSTTCGDASAQRSRPLAFSYDLAGDLTTEFDEASGAIHYTYSPAGEVTSITNGTYNDTYNPGNLVTNIQNGPNGPISWILGNGLTGVYMYDNLGHRDGGWVCSGGSPQIYCQGSTQIYGWVAETRGPQLPQSWDTLIGHLVYGYDEFNRVSSTNINSGQQGFSYVYDRYGNRWQQNVTAGSGPSFSQPFSGYTNHMTTVTYDAAGNYGADPSHTYQYDAEGNLIQVGGGNTASYVYDALNRRVRVQTPSQTNEFTYDYTGRRISTWNASNNFGTEGRIYWDNRQIAFRSLDGTTYFEHQDWLGTERMRTDYTGAVALSSGNYPWGDGQWTALNRQYAGQDNYSFAGLDCDTETATCHAQFRQYNPGQGRWMSPDPYSGSYDFNNPQSFNRYSYVLNNPLSFTDPTGLGPCPADDPCPSGGDDGWIGLFIAIGAAIGSLFGFGGPSFHGTLQPRPNVSTTVGNASYANGVYVYPVTVDVSYPALNGYVAAAAGTTAVSIPSLIDYGQAHLAPRCNSAFSHVIPRYTNARFFNALRRASIQQYPPGSPNIPSHALGIDADTAINQPGAPIRLFPNFYGNNTSYQAFVLVHEGIHHFTQWTDSQIFNNFSSYGLQPQNYGTADITTWLQGGCRE